MSDAKSKIARALMKDPEWEYGSILPIATRGPREGESYGDVSLALPDMIRDPLASWVKIRDSDFSDYDTQDVLNIMPVPAAAGAAGVPKAALGMFGGRLAATADQSALKLAEAMDARGKATREQIYELTGWFKGVDGKWRFEIDDSQARALPSADVQAGKNAHSVPLSEVMSHPDFLKAYPDAQALKAQAWNGKLPNGADGSYYDGRGMIYNAASADNGRSIMLHELQHAAQGREGFAQGGQVGNQDYRRLAGEVEARTVQKRQKLTPLERRARPPWYDYDVPEHEQIVRALLGKP